MCPTARLNDELGPLFIPFNNRKQLFEMMDTYMQTIDDLLRCVWICNSSVAKSPGTYRASGYIITCNLRPAHCGSLGNRDKYGRMVEMIWTWTGSVPCIFTLLPSLQAFSAAGFRQFFLQFFVIVCFTWLAKSCASTQYYRPWRLTHVIGSHIIVLNE